MAVMSAFPDDLDIHSILAEYKEGTDSIFNPKVKRVLDVQLVHNLIYERCVCVSLVSCQNSVFKVVAALCVALGSRRMARYLPQVAIGCANLRHQDGCQDMVNYALS